MKTLHTTDMFHKLHAPPEIRRRSGRSLGSSGLLGVSSLLHINANRSRAERYGVDAGPIGLDGGLNATFRRTVDDVLEFISEDAEYFDCVREVEQA